MQVPLTQAAVFAPASSATGRNGNHLQRLRPKKLTTGAAGTTRRLVADSRTAPAVGTVTADTPLSASPRSAVPTGTTSPSAGGTTAATRCPSQALGLQ